MFPGTVSFSDPGHGLMEVTIDGSNQVLSVGLSGTYWCGVMPFVGDRVLVTRMDRSNQILSCVPIIKKGTLSSDLEEFSFCPQCIADVPHRRVLVTNITRDNMFWVRLECLVCTTRHTERRKAEFVGRCNPDRTERYMFCRECAAITPWKHAQMCIYCKKRSVLFSIPRRQPTVKEHAV